MTRPGRGHGRWHGRGLGREREQGSATIWVVGCGLLLLLVALAVLARTLGVVARRQAESAADLAALAAATRIGVTTDDGICVAAADWAARNRARLRACTLRLAADGRSGEVRVSIAVPERLPWAGVREVVASARAARLPAAR